MKRKIVYCTPSLYIAGGVERVLTTKVNYLAELTDKYDITIVLTDGFGKKPFYPLSNKITVINLNINFEELWSLSFVKKIPAYLKKQRLYRKKLRKVLIDLKPDITVSTLRREINFINNIADGSRKIGEMHINRQNFRNFSNGDTNIIKQLFSKWWGSNLVKKLKKLDCFVVLTEADKLSWTELSNVIAIPNPLPQIPPATSQLTEKRVIAVGRYAYEKGFDLLLQAWSQVEKECPDWRLTVFGSGNKEKYYKMLHDLGIDESRCELCGAVEDIGAAYLNSSIFVLSSRFEGFGMALLEAMSYRLAVVSFDCPYGPRAIIDNHQNGILVENGNTAELANTIIKLIKDRKQQECLANSAYEKAHLYDIRVIGKRWEQLFDELITNH